MEKERWENERRENERREKERWQKERSEIEDGNKISGKRKMGTCNEQSKRRHPHLKWPKRETNDYTPYCHKP